MTNGAVAKCQPTADLMEPLRHGNHWRRTPLPTLANFTVSPGGLCELMGLWVCAPTQWPRSVLFSQLVALDTRLRAAIEAIANRFEFIVC